MGKLVNIELPDGRVVSVPEEDAKAGTFQQESSEGALARSRATARSEEHSGVGSAARAALEGLADGLTGGIAGKAYTYFGGEDVAKDYQDRSAEQSAARTVGEVASVLAPTGLLGKGVKAATSLSVPGRAMAAGKAVGGGLKGDFVEGAILGAGSYLSKSNVTGDPLTVEGAFLDIGLGGVVDMGFGALGRKLKSSATKAKGAQAAEELEEAEVQKAVKGKQVFDRDYPALKELDEARTAARGEVKTLNSEIQKEIDAYDAFVASPAKFRRVTKGIDTAINTVQGRYRPLGTPGTVEEALAQAQAKAGTTLDRFAVTELAKDAGTATLSKSGDEAVSFSQNVGKRSDGVKVRVSLREKLDPRPPMSEELANRLKGWQKEAQEIRQLFAGGREVNPNRWKPLDENIPRNPKEAVRRLHELRKNIWKHAQDAAGSIPDIPALPRDLVPDIADIYIPTDALKFSRKHKTQIADLANSMSAKEAEAVGRLADDLGLSKVDEAGNAIPPGKLLDDVHSHLQDYSKAMDSVSEKLAKEEAGAIGATGFGKLMHHASRLVGARAGNKMLGGGVLGGAVGWATGNFMGGIVGTALGGVLMNGKAGIRNRVRDLFAKHGLKAGEAVGQLAPVSSVLATKILGGGKEEDDGDIRALAKRRAEEIRGLQSSAADIGFSAFEPLATAPGDLMYKMHQMFVGAVNHLADTAPRDPGLAISMFDSEWTPSYQDSWAFAHRMEAVYTPDQAVARILEGDGHPAAAETLWAFYPGMMSAVAEEAANNAEFLANLTHQQMSAYSMLFRTPLSGFQRPEIASALQAMYLPNGPGGEMPPPEETSNTGTGNPPGRPPATGRSPVAGSNVTMTQRLQTA